LQRKIATQHPALWDIAEKYLIAFSSPYLVEKGFDVAKSIFKEQRNQRKTSVKSANA
jgi:hypothetical protein